MSKNLNEVNYLCEDMDRALGGGFPWRGYKCANTWSWSEFGALIIASRPGHLEQGKQMAEWEELKLER